MHLIHHTHWPDVDGETVAYVELNYADGSKAVLPICYGRHVLDWTFMPSYEQDLPSDPDTKVCWRYRPLVYKGPSRFFKSKLLNPSPAKVVETMDVVSARSLSTYVLVAATVADRDRRRTDTPPIPATEPDRKFEGNLVLRVTDAENDTPIEGALIQPSMIVREERVVAPPQTTSTAGTTTLRYPLQQTSEIGLVVKKDGYQPQWQGWKAPDLPQTFTVWLKP